MVNSKFIRLCVMMFLQYFTWGAWFVTLGSYIGNNTAGQGSGMFAEGFVGYAYGTAAIAGMIAPFFVGMIADRFFASQYVLAFCHVVGAGILVWLSMIDNQAVFYFALILYFLLYMPTLALTNSLSFHHLDRPGDQFPYVRVLGTIGWIAAGNFYALLSLFMGISVSEMQNSSTPMLVAAGSSLLLGLYCFALPHTPPKDTDSPMTVGKILGLDALVLLKRWPFLVFVIGSFLIAIPLQFYYNYTNFFLGDVGVENAVGKMTFGQMSEIFFMLLIPFFFVRLGVKNMLLIGMAAWVTRYVLFAFGDAGSGFWMLFLGILLHGICYDFFFVTGQIYVEKNANERIRGAAQGLITFVTLGVGAFVGANLSGMVEAASRTDDGVNWTQFWLIPAGIAGVVLILFAIMFNDPKIEEEVVSESELTPGNVAEADAADPIV
ncbi:MAG: nucleoside permease [Pirellulaceae bacterium]